MKDINKTYVIQAPVEKVWQALVDPEVISQWSGEPALMSDKPGSTFKLWGGSIVGVNKNVIAQKELTQTWRENDWQKGHYSEVSFILIKNGPRTSIEFTQTEVPDDKYKDISEGWDKYYIGQIKDLLEAKQ